MPPDGSTREILICRHGETLWNRERRIMGSLDIPLSDAGRRQCELLGRVLRGFAITRIVSSPLARAEQTARILAEHLAVELSFDRDREEVRFGRWQGLTYEEIRDDPEYGHFAMDPIRRPTPGGETVVDVQARGLAAIDRVRPGERTLFVSHGDIIRATLCHFLAVPLEQFRRLRIDNCGVSALAQADDHIEVKFLNMLPDPERVMEPLHWARAS
jgi:broad specificity phosphatase PhoE